MSSERTGNLREDWESPPIVEGASYLEALRKKLKETTQLAQAELGKEQEQKGCYAMHVRPKAFLAGQQVLLLLPSSNNKLLMQWQGPYCIR